MSFSRFSGPRRALSGQSGGPCVDPDCKGTLVEWDCGCSWGCTLCWVSLECNQCHTKYKTGTPAPRATRAQCPHCGQMKVGLADHINAKHKNAEEAPQPLEPVTPVGHSVTCGDCNAPMALRKSRFGLFYGCTRYPTCTGSHGASADGTPNGKPANKETRRFRIMAHGAFDKLWQPGPDQLFSSRRSAYVWLQKVMGMTSEEAHIANFDIIQCRMVIEACWAPMSVKSPMRQHEAVSNED